MNSDRSHILETTDPMTTRMHRQIASIAVDIAYLGSCITEVEHELATNTAILKGNAYDTIGPSGAGVSDPTAAAALTPDPIRQDHDRLRNILTTIANLTHEATVIASNHRSPDPATLKRNLRHLAANGEPGCDNHTRINEWTPIYRTGTVGDRLPARHALCRACYDFVGIHNRLPSRKELTRARHTGKLQIIGPPAPVR